MGRTKSVAELQRELDELDAGYKEKRRQVLARKDDAEARAGYRSERKSRDHAAYFLGGAVLEALGGDWRSVDPYAFRATAMSLMRGGEAWRRCIVKQRSLKKANDAYYAAEAEAKEDKEKQAREAAASREVAEEEAADRARAREGRSGGSSDVI